MLECVRFYLCAVLAECMSQVIVLLYRATGWAVELCFAIVNRKSDC